MLHVVQYASLCALVSIHPHILPACLHPFMILYVSPPKGLLGVFLNAVTIAAFLKVRELRTPSNFLVFSLALADIGISMNATVAAFSSFLR